MVTRDRRSPTRTHRTTRVCLLTILALLLSAVVPFLPLAAAAEHESVGLLGAPDGVEAPKGHPKMESALDDVRRTSRINGFPGARELAARSGIEMLDDQVRVVLDTQHGKSAAALVKRLGGTSEGWFGDLLQATVPLSALEELADSPHIRFIRRPLPTTIQAVSEGVGATHAETLHGAGYDGAGVKVAVLDLGFAGYAALLGTELPATVNTQSFRADGDLSGGGQPHGMACAEIVHDMAPGAELYLVNFQTELEFSAAVDWLIAQGVDVITSSIGWVNAGPYDGTGAVCDAVERAYAAGIMWSNSAGNQALRHWEGTFQDADADKIHEFATGVEVNTFTAQAGDDITLFLSWEDSWTAATQDYDLYLMRRISGSWSAIAASLNWQNGRQGQSPTESISTVAPADGTYAALIYRYSATQAVHQELYSFGNDFSRVVESSSLLIPADAEHALTVGAFRVGTGALESFSGQGPTNDGRLKPDLLGPDFVSTSTYGSGAFGGTSAASPHAAGAAALLKQANPTWGPAEIMDELRVLAADNPGPAAADLKANDPPNNVTGYGNLDLASAQAGPSTWDIPLAEGWNLVSFPLAPESTAILDVLASIDGQYDIVYTYLSWDTADPWKTYNVALPPFLNDLTQLDERTGLWIHMTAAGTLTVSGSVPASTSIPLVTGWNLVGFPRQSSQLLAEALASIDAKYDVLYGYDAFDIADPWETYNAALPPFLNDLTDLAPGRGYWLQATEDCDLIIGG